MSLEMLWHDLRHVGRGMTKARLLTVATVVTLALAIGGSAAVFGLLNALVLRKVPVPEPDSLVHIAVPSRISPEGPLSYPIVRALGTNRDVLTDLTSWTAPRISNVESTRGVIQHAIVLGVDGNYHQLLDVKPFAGRALTPDDVRAGAESVAVISHPFWTRTFGGDPTVVGRLIWIEGHPFRIVGVTPASFTGLVITFTPDVTIPYSSWLDITKQPAGALFDGSSSMWLNAVGRLAPGVTVERARARLNALWPGVRTSVAPLIQNARQREEFANQSLLVRSAATGLDPFFGAFRARYTKPLTVLWGLTALLGATAVVSIVGLLIVRTADRQTELATRMVLGASRWRLTQQALIESCVLALLGVGLGVATANPASHAIAGMILSDYPLPFSFDSSPDRSGFAIWTAVAITIAAIISVPSLSMIARGQPSVSTGTRATSTHMRRLTGWLVTAQIALSMALVIPAGLFAQSLYRLRSADTGVTERPVTVAYPMSRPGGYQGVDNDTYYPALIGRVAALRGVDAAGVMQFKPYMGGPQFPVSRLGSTDNASAFYTPISPGALATLEVSLLRGRDVNWSDNARSVQVAIVSASLSSRLFGASDPVGQHVQIQPNFPDLEIIGVARNARVVDLRTSNTQAIYVPSLQVAGAANNKFLIIRGTPAAEDVAGAVAALGHEVVLTSQSLEEIADRVLVQDRILSAFGAFFGGLSLLLSGIGLYSMIAYSVVRRTREIAIRVALGSDRRRVTGDVLRGCLVIAVPGVLIGLVAARALSTALGSVLVDVQPVDRTTFAAAPILLLAISLLAAALPAVRAARIEPARALRVE